MSKQKARELFIMQDDLERSGLDCCVVYVSRQTPTDLVFREVLTRDNLSQAELVEEIDLEVARLKAKIQSCDFEFDSYRMTIDEQQNEIERMKKQLEIAVDAITDRIKTEYVHPRCCTCKLCNALTSIAGVDKNGK